MVYGPIAAALVSSSSLTRIRYSGLSLPYHIGNGWFGGLSPPGNLRSPWWRRPAISTTACGIRIAVADRHGVLHRPALRARIDATSATSSSTDIRRSGARRDDDPAAGNCRGDFSGPFRSEGLAPCNHNSAQISRSTCRSHA